MTIRRRYLVAAPFALVLLAALVGGWVNTIDARGRVVDDLTEQGISGAAITFGARATTSRDDGGFTLTNVPRTSRYAVEAPGYSRTSAPTSAEEVRLKPFQVTLSVYDETKTPADGVKNPQARNVGNTKVLATGDSKGIVVVSPHPGKDASVVVCAEGFEPRTITVQGVRMQVGLRPGGTGCPPLPTPSPAPGATPSPSGPAPSLAPSPTASP